MKTLASVANCGLVPFPVWCEGHACADMDDRQPVTEDANAALLAWYRHLVADRMSLDEIVEEAHPLSAPEPTLQPLSG
jgi:hypothetical protein